MLKKACFFFSAEKIGVGKNVLMPYKSADITCPVIEKNIMVTEVCAL